MSIKALLIYFASIGALALLFHYTYMVLLVVSVAVVSTGLFVLGYKVWMIHQRICGAESNLVYFLSERQGSNASRQSKRQERFEDFVLEAKAVIAANASRTGQMPQADHLGFLAVIESEVDTAGISRAGDWLRELNQSERKNLSFRTAGIRTNAQLLLLLHEADPRSAYNLIDTLLESARSEKKSPPVIDKNLDWLSEQRCIFVWLAIKLFRHPSRRLSFTLNVNGQEQSFERRAALKHLARWGLSSHTAAVPSAVAPSATGTGSNPGSHQQNPRNPRPNPGPNRGLRP